VARSVGHKKNIERPVTVVDSWCMMESCDSDMEHMEYCTSSLSISRVRHALDVPSTESNIRLS
jgi:hypothetical protein